MKPLLATLLLILLCISLQANDSIQVKINQLSFSAKDSIQFACRIPNYATQGLAAVTLNVWIQDLESKQTWKFRYPVLNGECDASLAIDSAIKPGKYAVNFIVQKGLFRLRGLVKNHYKEKSLNYLMIVKGKKSFFNTVDLGSANNFTIKNVLFEDEAFFVFTPPGKVKRNELLIDVAAPLDSTFEPLAIFTQLIDVKPELNPNGNTGHPKYNFDFQKTYTNTTLPDVVVTYKGKKKIEQYDETYSNGLFKDNNAKVFDGLESDEIARASDIETFLQSKIPGLSITRSEIGESVIQWRQEPVVIYVDEFMMETGTPIPVAPSDVAMIKVYNPPASVNSGIGKSAESPSMGFSGAIAIYTKKGSFDNNTNRRFRFTFKGYTALEGIWR